MSILHALTGLYDRLESNREAPSYGFSRENISYAIDQSRMYLIGATRTPGRRPGRAASKCPVP